MARKVFLATDEMREQVRSWAARGVRQEDIATMIRCDAKTLRKRLRIELDLGMAEANAKVSGSLFDAAMDGNVTAQIFWHKTRMKYREREGVEDPTPGNDAVSTSPVVILPDNGRDPGLTVAFLKAQEEYLGMKKPR